MSLSNQKGIVYGAQVEWLVSQGHTDRKQKVRGQMQVGKVMSWELVEIFLESYFPIEIGSDVIS